MKVSAIVITYETMSVIIRPWLSGKVITSKFVVNYRY